MTMSKIKNVVLLMNKKAIDKCLKKFSFIRWNVLFPFLLFCKGTKIPKMRIRSIYNILQEKKCVKSIKLSSTDTVSLVSQSSFYKFPITEDGDKRINLEYVNWKVARNVKTELIIPNEEFIRHGHVAYLKMPLLQITPDEIKSHSYSHVLNSLHFPRTLSDTEITNDIKRGYEVLGSICGLSWDEAFVESFERGWLRLKAFRSATHGDLHPGNIMQYDNHPVLIDMDRFDVNGFTGFDLIHLYLRTVETSTKGWMYRLKEIKLKEVLEEFDTDVFDLYSPQEWNMFKTAYWIDRIGKEQKFGNKLTPALRAQTLSMFSYIKEQWVNPE